MSRRDEFGEVPSLIPDSDEINSSRNSSRSKGKISAQSDRSGSVEGSQLRSSLPARAASYGIPADQRETRVIRRWSGIPLSLIWLLMAAGGMGGYWYHSKLTDMELLLTATRDKLEHSRRRIGELEALIVATDANANQSGTVVRAQVKMLDERSKERIKLVDSEIDKLWGVSYRINKPIIVENKKAIENNAATLTEYGRQVNDYAQSIDQQQSFIQNQQAKIDDTANISQKATVAVGNQQVKLDLQIKTLQSQQKQIGELISQVAIQQSDSVSLTEQLQLLGRQNSDQQQNINNLNDQLQIISDELTVTKAVMELTNTTVGQLQTNANQLQNEFEQLQPLDNIASKNGKQLVVLQQQLARLRRELENSVSGTTDLKQQLSILAILDQTTGQLDERVYEMEQDILAINSFRRDTNVTIEKFRSQITALQYQ